MNKLVAQNFTVSSTVIEKHTKGESLDQLEYQISENGVLKYDNGNWVAVQLNIPSQLAKNQNFIHLSYSLLDTIELWTKSKNNNLKLGYQTGQAFKFNTRPYASTDFIFPTIEGVQSYYFRIYSSKPIVIPLDVVTSKEVVRRLTLKDYLYGIFTGIIAVMFLYNLMLYFLTGDKSYAYYIFYLFTLIFAQLALFGYTDRFITHDWPSVNSKFVLLTASFVVVASVFFIINFLNLKQKLPTFTKLLYFVYLLVAFGSIFLILDWDVLAFHWINFTALYGSILGLIAAVKLTLKGYRPAKIFLLAWLIFLISVIIFALMNIGVLPYKWYFQSSMAFGSAIEAVLLSIALAEKINTLRRENEKSQRKTLQMVKENTRIINEQNAILDQRVQIKTKELQRSNKELKIALNDLRATQSQLIHSEKMASLGVLTAGIAHELNNPLNYIHGGVKAITQELQNSKEINEVELKEYLSWIKLGEERATKIVKSLNSYSKTDYEFRESCEIHAIIEDCLMIMQHRLNGKIDISKEFQDKPCLILGNKGQLHQLFLNLLTNAIDFIDKEGTIKISTQFEANHCIICIEDDGLGIRKEYLNKVLEPFFTTKSHGEGTGLGLSIVYSIIKNHKGDIRIESEPGEGTKVILSIPID